MRKIFIFMTLFTSVYGQITLHQCLEKAITNNPVFQASRLATESARQEVRQANAARLPSLDFSGSYRRQSTVPELRIDAIELPFGGSFTPFPGGSMRLGTADNYDFRLTLSQPLFTGFRLYNTSRAAVAMSQAKEYELWRARNELIYQVEATYAAVLKAQQFRAIAETVVEQVDLHLKDVKNLIEQGLVRKDELLKVQVKRSEAELALLRADNAVFLARAALENLQGSPLPAEMSLEPMTPDSGQSPDINTSLKTAVENRPELRLFFHSIEAAEAGLKIAQGGRLPAFAAFASFGYGKPGLDFINKEWMDYWLVGIAAEWNLWNWGKISSQIQQAELNLQKVTYNQRQAYDAITLEVTQAYLQWQEAQKRLVLAELMEKQAGENFRVSEQQYRQGQASHSDFFDAQSEWTRARLQKTEAIIDVALAQANWRKAVGLSARHYGLLTKGSMPDRKGVEINHHQKYF